MEKQPVAIALVIWNLNIFSFSKNLVLVTAATRKVVWVGRHVLSARIYVK